MRFLLVLFSLPFFALLGTEESHELRIRTILLVGEESDKSLSENLQENEAYNIPLPHLAPQLLASLLSFQGELLSSEKLKAIKEAILAFYQQHGFPLIAVELPEQEVSNGTVCFIVKEARTGKITFSGNRYFSKCYIRNYLSLETGGILDKNQLLDDLNWINQNPFLRAEALFSKGEKPMTIDVELLMRERFPIRAYAGVDNTGTSILGQMRTFAGITYGFFFGNLLSLQATASFDFHKFLSCTANFTHFASWKHEIMVYGGYAVIDPPIDNFRSKGRSVQASLRYAIPFKPLYTPFTHRLLWGADFKQTNSNLFFADAATATLVPVTSKTAALFQFNIGYALNSSLPHHEITFSCDLFFSPFIWLPNQSKSHYNNLREDASPHYCYGRVKVGDLYKFSEKGSFASLLRLQASNSALLPSEQFGLGGYDTVRGYEERIFDGDDALCFNAESRYAFPYFFTKKRPNPLTLLAFFDFGLGHNHHSTAVERSFETLLSIGPGLRYEAPPRIAVRADYGFALHHIPHDGDRIGRFHFSFIAAY